MYRSAPHIIDVHESVIPPLKLAELNRTIDEVRKAGASHDALYRLAPQIGGALREVGEFARIEQAALRRAEEWVANTVQSPAKPGPWYVLRCTDKSEPARSHCRHYDSHALTVLIVLQAAKSRERSGDLVLYRQPRRVPNTVTNLLHKCLQYCQQRLPFSIREKQTRRDIAAGKSQQVTGVPGTVYVFNGFVNQHCNLDIESGERRSLLIHYLDPGFSMGVSTLARVFRGVPPMPEQSTQAGQSRGERNG